MRRVRGYNFMNFRQAMPLQPVLCLACLLLVDLALATSSYVHFLYLCCNRLFSVTEAQSRAEFAEFCSKHRKKYDNGEQERRFAIFRQNMQTMAELQKQHPTIQLGPNDHQDLTDDEFFARSRPSTTASTKRRQPSPQFVRPASNEKIICMSVVL